MYKTPKKLKKINIMGTDVKIKIDNAMCAAHGAMGLHTQGNIVLLSEYNGTAEFVDTLTHECFHALSYILGTQLDSHVEEILANTMGQINVKIINALLTNGTFCQPEEDESKS